MRQRTYLKLIERIITAFRVTVWPAGWTFDAGSTETLLVSAEQAGVVLPSSCRNGSCRTCLVQVTRGAARHLVPWPGLSLEEKNAGWILPCVATPMADVEVQAPAARRPG